MSPETTGKPSTRRRLLKGVLNLVWAVPLALTINKLLQFLRFEPPTTQTSLFVVGTPATLTVLPAFIEDAQVWLHQDLQGFYAIDATCTHLGCIVHLQPNDGYHCRCHGSRFALDGSLKNGPA